MTLQSFPLMSSHLMGAIFWVLVQMYQLIFLHLEWISPCFHHFSPKHHVICPCTPHQLFSVGNTSQLYAINTEHQIFLEFVPAQCLHLGYTSHTLMENGSTSCCHLVKPWMLSKIGKIVITSTEITRGLGRDENVSGHCVEQAGKVWDQ